MLRLKILISFFYYRDTDLDDMLARHFKPPYPEIFADSGAFSAYSQGRPISVQEYAEWLVKYKHLFGAYANLDVKGDVDLGLKNQNYLESQGLKPVPVFHAGEPISVLADMISAYNYIALGGVAGESIRGAPKMRWLIDAFKRARGKAVYHGFGMTDWKIISNFPWYSVDSSSWGQGFRYGAIPIFKRETGKFVKINLGDHAGWYRHAKTVRAMGFDPGDFADRKRNTRQEICAISALSYMEAEKYLKRMFGDVHIPRNGRSESGLKIYLADGGGLNKTSNITYADAGLKLYLAESSNNLIDTRRIYNHLEASEQIQ